jgi:hypothetical protein
MKGQQLIDFIQNNNLQDADVTVTATVYKEGDHDCYTTDEISVSSSSKYDRHTKKYSPTLDIYVDDNLY